MILKERISKGSSTGFTVLIGLILAVGWRLRGYELITAERGIGYVCGIIGFVLMSVLLLYPLRKRVRALEIIGGVKTWFRIHMLLGVIGPVFILYHCNFQLGSFNSNVALFSMVIVSVSGIFGRYFYARIHHGLYGQRATLVELRRQLEGQKEELSPQLDLVPGLREKLFAYSDRVIDPPKTLGESVRRRALTDLQVLRVKWAAGRIARRSLEEISDKHHWSDKRLRQMVRQMRRKSDQLIRQTRKVAEFGFYERLFVMWHIFHIPLVYMLFIAAVIHIIAVHLY